MKKSVNFVPVGVPTFKARVLGEEDNEFYKEVQTKTAEKFGRDSRAYETIMNEINTDNVTGSQFFWNNQVDLYLPKGQRVMNLEDLGGIYNADSSFFSGHFSDTTSLLLRSKIPNWDKNKQILGYLERQLRGEKINGEKIEFGPENPILISGLELIKDTNGNNFYGIKLKLGNDAKIVYAPEFAASKDTIKFGNIEKSLWTKSRGLSRVYVDDDSSVNSNNDYLHGSNDYGWVVVVDAEGVAPKNLEKFTNKLDKLKQEYQENLKELKSEIDSEINN